MEREEWKSKTGFILASIGSAVGLGNIWRFPYIMNKAGGSGFLIPYIICVLLLGIPIMILEFATGRKFKSSIIKSFEKMGSSKFIAIFPVLINFLTLCYYIVIVGWVLGFLIMTITNSSTEFSYFIKTLSPTFFTLMSILIITFTVFLGVEKGIERISKIFMPLFFIILIILLMISLSYPGSAEGIKKLFAPDFSKLKEAKTWLLAAGQALFSLSVGLGIMITYGSYLSKKENIPSSSVIVAFSDTLIALINGIIIFSIISTFNVEIEQGSRLAFDVLPKLFSRMESGFIVQLIFFLLLFIAGITSAISMNEVSISNLMDELNWDRKKSTIASFLLLTPISLIISLNYSGYLASHKNLLEIFDHLFGTLFLILSTAIVCFVLSWNWNTKQLLEEVDIKLEGISKRFDRFFENEIFINLLRYIIPTILITLFLAELGV